MSFGCNMFRARLRAPIAALALLGCCALVAAGGCRSASPAERIQDLLEEKAEVESREREVVADIERRRAAYDARILEDEARAREKFLRARREKVGPSAERFRSAMNDPAATDPERVREANPKIAAARNQFAAADRKYGRALDAREQEAIDALERKRRAVSGKFLSKKVEVMTKFGERRREIEQEIAEVEAEGR